MRSKSSKEERVEKYLEASMKNMRSALGDLTMKEFVLLNIQTLFGMEREEYLAEAPSDKGNGHYERSLRSLMKDGLVIKVPRTREGGFAPLAFELFKMNQEQVNDLCLTLYKKGMTSRDISDVMEKFFGNSVSHTTITELANQFHDIRLAWEKSSLNAFYKVIYGDCLYITVRRGDSYSLEAVYILYGVTADNTRELLALSVNPTESMETWTEIFSSLKKRGVEETLLVVTDGIQGMENVVQKTFPGAKFQKCAVHKMRNVLNSVRPKDKTEMADDLKDLFDNFDSGASKTAAGQKVLDLVEKWKSKYKDIGRFFREGSIEYYFTYIDFPPDVRRLIYTTNGIENLNRAIRKATKNKLAFGKPETLLDYVFVVIKEFEEKNWCWPVYQFSFIHRNETQ